MNFTATFLIATMTGLFGQIAYSQGPNGNSSVNDSRDIDGEFDVLVQKLVEIERTQRELSRLLDNHQRRIVGGPLRELLPRPVPKKDNLGNPIE